ncbi:MAG: hypothetical protein COT00_03610 [Candidatus Omnitrophica bacterium CG07_land_8_20_14_0_80_50_8]|nr:MAG: hypothetical protein COT00_03610 [Candidatus Omnitrophica bacterium CG07_land_8_20_14_0_80_50_8]
MKPSKIFLICLFTLLISGFAHAESPLEVKTRAWPVQVTIGGEIKLFIQIRRPRSFSIIPPSPKMPLGSFEVTSVAVSAYREMGSSIQQTFLLRLTIFEIGEFQIPPFSISYTEPGNFSGKAWTEPVSVKVVSVIKDPKEKADIRPIKGPVSLDTAILRALIFGTLAIFLAVWLAVKIILRRRNKRLIDLESLKPPHERAMLELERLQARALLNEGRTKEFYSELADILRRYLERRFKIETLELTTFEILAGLKRIEFPSDLAVKVKEFLENSDLVKFAKFVPPRSLADQMVVILRELVERTMPVEEEAAKKGVVG